MEKETVDPNEYLNSYQKPSNLDDIEVELREFVIKWAPTNKIALVTVLII